MNILQSSMIILWDTWKQNQYIKLPDNSDPCSVGHFGWYGTLKPEKVYTKVDDKHLG